jgi:uracil-DNA glycosylase
MPKSSFYSLLDDYPKLMQALAHDLGRLCPSYDLIFKAVEIASTTELQCVILGQEPYYVPGKANGIAFGYHSDYKGPVISALRNIKQEIYQSTGQTLKDTTLESLARQGVLLLNLRLTTVEDQPKAHTDLGWESIVTALVEKVNNSSSSMAFLLWGEEARGFKKHIDNKIHLVLEAAHPATSLFKGCDHFDLVNTWLKERGRKELKWGEYLA